MTAKERVAALEASLANERRHAGAMCEWFVCERRDEPTIVNVTTGIRVLVRGLGRASGGVVVVESGIYRDFPIYLDDLVSTWLADSAPEIRAAARAILSLRDHANEASVWGKVGAAAVEVTP